MNCEHTRVGGKLCNKEQFIEEIKQNTCLSYCLAMLKLNSISISIKTELETESIQKLYLMPEFPFLFSSY